MFACATTQLNIDKKEVMADPVNAARISVTEKKRIVMITGQQEECTQERFDKYYKPAIEAAVAEGCCIYVGAAEKGCDAMAHELLQALGATDVVVFDKGDKDGRGAKDKGWHLVNGFEDFHARDDGMIAGADRLIVYLFENAVASGTWRNVMAAAGKAVCDNTRFGESKWYDVVRQVMPDLLTVTARVCIRDAPFADRTWEYRDCFASREFLYMPK